ncbi:hypothetical protein BDQ17DRAFT_1426489 [Cyathus striatus]|nr:hypothetical protein BDQ17DRAFT_1426489 [Cyathus striatus]
MPRLPPPIRLQRPSRPTPAPRVKKMYVEGADPDTANSPPAFRCPRHLHTGCEICVEARTSAKPTGATSRNRSSSASASLSVSSGGGGRKLARVELRGSVLRRRVSDTPRGEKGKEEKGNGNTKLSRLIPRFVRLSALVAAELGREMGGEGSESSGSEAGGFEMLPESGDESVRDAVRAAGNKFFDAALRPTREWYMLLAGLLTRAVLEGYLTAGWRGSKPMECLLTFGLGIGDAAASPSTMEAAKGEEEWEEYEPDELPSLLEAVRILFPSLRRGARREGPEEEYECEMVERLRRFYDVPASTPDLSTHMEDLAWSYPAEPVERAAVRFCEAIAKWRGKPELETYKKKPPQAVITSPGSTVMTIESLVHSNPTSPQMGNAHAVQQGVGGKAGRVKKRPSIDTYFCASAGGAAWGRGVKRGRGEGEEGRSGGSKRVRT